MLDIDLNISIKEEEVDEPFVGQTFESQEEAYIFYKNYATRFRFVARKDRTDVKHGRTIRRDFVCNREGKTRAKVIDPSKSQRNKGSSKCDCHAHMRITLRRCFDIFPEEWHVTIFKKEHNHDLLSPEALRFLPANRIITLEDEKEIMLYKEAGLSIRQIIRVMELKKNVKHGELTFFDRDIRNLFGKVKRIHGVDDARNLIEYMKVAKEGNKNFHYEFTVDDDRRLENLFWCQTQSFDWYQKYGDVVVFDTTYKVNSFDMPCGIFVGVDNHGKTILFGCALLRNETVSTFKWLMKTFVRIMKKPPKTIITDQDPWMSEAISVEMPITKHNFCVWHITSKFSCWFAALLRDDYQNWCGDFYKMYKMTDPEEFEIHWSLMVQKYNLQNNKHVEGLHKVRYFWAPTYLRDYFFGGMITTGRSESINAFIKRFVSSHTRLTDFVKQIDIAIQEISQEHLHNNVVATLRPPSLKTKSPLEKQALHVLTPFAFRTFQEEFARGTMYSIVHVEGSEFVLKYFEGENSRLHKVFWDGNTSSCSCKNFEFWGILCRHILRIYIHSDCFKIPPFYLPTRWRGDTLQTTSCTQEVEDDSSPEEERIPIDGVLCPPQSKTKGRPKKKREKSGKELGKKQTKSCSICQQPGHTKPTCPNKDYIFSTKSTNVGASSSSQKKSKKTTHELGLNPIFSLKI